MSPVGTLNGMGWMTGSGPLSKAPARQWNFEPPPAGRTIYLEHTPKRIRVEVGGEVIADSRNAFILHESGLQPTYYFPPEDVRSDLLQPTDRHTHCPKKGDASYYTIQAGGQTVENGAWYYPDPLPDAPFIKDLVAFYFHRMGRWLEESEQIFVAPHATPITAWTWSAATATSACCWRARWWPRPIGRWRCSSPTCRRAGTSPPRT